MEMVNGDCTIRPKQEEKTHNFPRFVTFKRFSAFLTKNDCQERFTDQKRSTGLRFYLVLSQFNKLNFRLLK